MAALSLAESLVLALAESGVLDREVMEAVLDDAIQRHRRAAATNSSPEVHGGAAEALERVKRGLSCLHRG